MADFVTSILNWIGMGETPQDPQRSWSMTPPTNAWPSDQDVVDERIYKQRHGNQNYEDFSVGDRMSTVDSMRDMNANRKTGFDPAPPQRMIDPETAMTLSKTSIAAGKSPVAAPDRTRTTISPPSTGMTNITGSQYPRTDRMWANMADPPALLHETIHRGLTQMAAENPEMKKLLSKWDEETLVRALMVRHFGNVEMSQETGPEAVGNKQIEQAKRAMKEPEYAKVIQDIERAAHYKRAQKMLDTGQGPALGFRAGGKVTRTA